MDSLDFLVFCPAFLNVQLRLVKIKTRAKWGFKKRNNNIELFIKTKKICSTQVCMSTGAKVCAI